MTKNFIIILLIGAVLTLYVQIYESGSYIKTANRVQSHTYWALCESCGHEVSFEEMEFLAELWYNKQRTKIQESK